MRLLLQVAAREIDPDGVAEDVIEGARDGDVMAAALERHDELELVMQVLRLGRIGDGRAVLHQRVRRFHEEEGLLAAGVAAHLARKLGIVPADAINAAHRKARRLARDGQGRQIPGRNGVFGHVSSAFLCLNR